MLADQSEGLRYLGIDFPVFNLNKLIKVDNFTNEQNRANKTTG